MVTVADYKESPNENPNENKKSVTKFVNIYRL